MRKLPLPPRFLKDIDGALRASIPHKQRANAAQQKALALLRELNDETSPLSPEERAARRVEIEKLHKETYRENQAAHAVWDELKARHPGWFH